MTIIIQLYQTACDIFTFDHQAAFDGDVQEIDIDESSLTDFDDAYEDDDIITGGCHQAVDRAKEFVLSRIQNSQPFWIGATSNGERGCRGRWNKTYKSSGMNRMAPVYKTSSARFRDDMEKELIRYFKKRFPRLCRNVNKGGGGPIGRDMPYFIYLVWKD